LYDILTDENLHGIVIDVGMPFMHRGNRYNCRCIILNGKILLIRPKLYMANDGNYREMRFFIPWKGAKYMEEFKLPAKLAKVQGSRTVPIGDAILEFNDTSMGIETCEELFTSNAPHIQQALAGAEIFSNASGSHHNLRKLNKRLSLIRQACEEGGGVYIYANQQGCDGDRLYYDGCASIFLNGEIVAQGSQFSVQDVECVTAVVDLDEVASQRFAPSRGQQVNQTPEPAYPRIYVHLPEEEIALGPACWL
jgi:NAD+ synthase (glutamine-hydrolysing)